jgi:NAD(P)-dependent dehydrogenase (short-subunit alcohol dehydrogenase family)
VTAGPLDVFRPGLLAGRTSVVTGGGTGLGAAIAGAYAGLGARVAVLSRRPEHVERSAAKITAAGGEALAVTCDVRDPDQVAAAVDQVLATFGGVDILVNCAAGNFVCPAADLSPNGWRTVVDIDLGGTFLCSRAVVGPMRERGGGVILNITASFTDAHSEGMAHAGAAKAGIEHLSRTLAKEWGPLGIRVNSLAPGPFVTAGSAEMLGGTQAFDAMAATLPLRRAGTHAELAAAAVFLVCDAASYITGATIRVDGGHSFSGYRNGAVVEG